MWILLQGTRMTIRLDSLGIRGRNLVIMLRNAESKTGLKTPRIIKEKMFLWKQSEKAFKLFQAEQSDWLAYTDERNWSEQECKAHYSYMAKIQEVPNADSGTDAEPLEQVQYDTDDNVFANDIQHFEQSESITNTCVVETGDSNVIPDSPDMCDNDIQDDQNDVECDDEPKLNETLGLLAQKEIDIKEGLKVKAYEISVVKEKHDELVKQSLLTKSHYEGLVKEKTKVITDLKLKEEKDIDKMISMENQLKFLNEIVYKRSQSIQTIHILQENASNVFRKEREQYFEIQDLKAQLQDKNIAISELKKLIEKCKGKSVDTKFDKPSIVRQPNAQRILKPSVLGKPSPFSNSLERTNFATKKSVSKTNESGGLSKPVTPQNLPQTATQANLNVNAVCATCGKCVFNSNHDACVSKFLKDVNARTKKPNVVPISTRKPKSQANKSVATPHKKTVASESTITNSKSYYRMLYKKTNKAWKWWIAQQCPSAYTWVPKTKRKWVPKVRNESVTKKIVQLILFIVDSGCTKHMTGNLSLLCNFVEKYLGTVRFGNDQFAPILGYGDLVQGNITIKRVYYVEGLNHNLFSVGQFCDADLEVAFRKSTCFVRDLQGNDLLTGNRGTDLYTISLQETTSSTPICLMAKASPTQAWLWHRRLSHLNFDYINLLSKKDVVIGLPKLKYVKDQLCSSCEVSKAKRSSFKSKTVPSSKGWLNWLHMDLCGPMRVASINGKTYILVIVDDYSRYTWTLFLRSKDETPEVLKDFLTMIQRNLQAPIIFVRTDRGTEFLNKTLNAFFKEEGIEHQTSTPRTPEHNDVVERRNRTLVEAARMMLLASKLPLFFWAEKTDSLTLVAAERLSRFCRICCTQVFSNLPDGREMKFLYVPLKEECKKYVIVHIIKQDRLKNTSKSFSYADHAVALNTRKKILEEYSYRSYALSWKPGQGDSLSLPDHRIHKDGDGDALFQLKSDSLLHAH
ncbi:retrovirus-related pol polyprotein from transposon TNT 1-94 [Tanacetum coccineum]